MTRRTDFPLLATYPELAYLDSAATTQKPQAVITAVHDFYTQHTANIHRGMYDLSQTATDMFETTRQKVADFAGMGTPEEIIFTSGTTESLNLVAHGWARHNLQKGDIIVLSEMEHHSNVVPWLQLQKEIDVELHFLPLASDFTLDYAGTALDMSRVKLITLTHTSNVLGTINPVQKIANHFRANGAAAALCIDAAQTAAHLDLRQLDADFIVFSSHKMYGPSGVGVLAAKKQRLAEMQPVLTGSHMVAHVTTSAAAWADAPAKFEPGTRNLEGVIGLGAAIDYLNNLGWGTIDPHETELTRYALEQLQNAGVTLYGPTTATERLGVFSFAIGTVHPHDTAEILNRHHVAIRAGHHCAQPLMTTLGVTGTARASLGIYNTKADIDILIRGIHDVKRIFNQ